MMKDSSWCAREGFIDDAGIWRTLEQARNPDASAVTDVLAKGRECVGLDQRDVAILLESRDRRLDEALFDAARFVKEQVYGNRIVLFAPLFVSTECGSSCEYCGFRSENAGIARRTLSLAEIRDEIHRLVGKGHKRVLAVYGDHPRFTAEWMAGTIDAMYSVRAGSSELRRVNVNCAPQSVEGFAVLRSARIGTYQCFQKTYHRETFEAMHPSGGGNGFLWRLNALDRAREAGIEDVAMGPLFGLFDPRFEILAMLTHVRHLEKEFGVGPRTMWFLRLESDPAAGSYLPPWEVSSYDFMRLIAITRLAVPYSGIVMPSREGAKDLSDYLQLGVSQIGTGTRCYPGACKGSMTNLSDVQQFRVCNDASLDEIILDLAERGYVPSFCTSCYRSGRTGDDFMCLAKSACICCYCQPNALLTFMEYLEDYASPATRKAGRALVERELGRVGMNFRPDVEARLDRIASGDRDVYF